VWLDTELVPGIEVAATLADLERLAPAWHRLWLRDPRAKIFQSPAWLIPWAKRFTAGTFCCVLVRSGDELVAFVPTFIWRNSKTHERELLLLGTGISDYTDGIFDPEHANEAARAAVAWLRENEDWDVLKFEQLPSHSPLQTEAESLDEQTVCPLLQLPDSIQQLPKVIPRAQLQNVTYYRRRAERMGNVAFERAGERSVGVMLEELFRLHSARWKRAGSSGALADANVRTFHREAARRLLAAGALRLYRLAIGGETAAVIHGMASHGRVCCYLSGLNPKFACVSPGALLIHHVIEQAVREGCTQFDFLRGSERYKYLWGARDTHTHRRVERRTAHDER
jgi:CelD/BcsL family acetyltransferase involved in cellulose biosynthesis